MNKGLKNMLSECMDGVNRYLVNIVGMTEVAKAHASVTATSNNLSAGDRADAARMVQMLSSMETHLQTLRNQADNVAMIVDDEEMDDISVQYDDDFVELMARR